MISLPKFSGHASYAVEPVGPHRILLAVYCRLSPSVDEVIAMVDTGCEWCVAAPDDFGQVHDLSPHDFGQLHTRFGLIDGFFTRSHVVFPADEGDDLVVEPTWFISADWNGPIVIGWKGGLERMNFAFDTVQERFWFGDQHS